MTVEPGAHTLAYRWSFDDGVAWQVAGGEWTCSGWAFAVDGAAFALILDIGGVQRPLSLDVHRPDVAIAYPQLVQTQASGFAGVFPVESGTWPVRLLAVRDGSDVVLASASLAVTPAPLHACLDSPDGAAVAAGVVRFSGWCYHPVASIDALLLLTGGTQVAAQAGLQRPDVAAGRVGAPVACGFEAFVSLPPGRTAVMLEAHLRDGTIVSTQLRATLDVRPPGLRTRARMLVVACRNVRQRLAARTRTRGRWPQLAEWPHLWRLAHHELTRAWRGGANATVHALPQPIDRYDAWLAVNRWSPEEAARLRARLAQCTRPLPTLGIVMPTFDPPLALLQAAVESVRAQVFDGWQLCIADDASTQPAISAYLLALADTDPRVRVRLRRVNGNISATTNDAASLADAQILVFLDHDDVLTPDCLAEIALAAVNAPDADVFYSDDDKLDTEGRRHAPQFKPQWSPDLLLSYMYMSHVFAVRRELFERMGGMRIGYEGSQDYDFALRATEAARSVVHIPRVLYHWRAVAGSTAASGDAKPASFGAGERAVADALRRRGMHAAVARPPWAVAAGVGIYAADAEDDGPAVTVVIPTRNQCALLKQCIDSLAATTYRDYRVLVVDNASDDVESLRYLAHCGHSVVRIESTAGRFNFAELNNRAVDHVDTEYVLFLNNDTEVLEPRWLSRMMMSARLPGVGAVGARLLYADGAVQHGGIVHGYYDGLAGPAFRNLARDDPGYLAYAMSTRTCSAVTAACLLVATSTFRTLGGFDAHDFGVAYNDVDFCVRLEEVGLRSVYVAGAELVHHEGRSRGFDDEPRELAAFRSRYRGKSDRYYSPHLSLDDERFAVQPVHLETGSPARGTRALMCAFNLNWEGAPYSQFELTRELKLRGVIDPVVYCPVDGPLRAAYEAAGITVHVRPHPLADVTTAGGYATAIAGFAAWLRTLAVDVVYANTLQTFYAIDAARVLGVPSLWNPRESEPWRDYFRGFGPDIERAALRCFAYPYRVIFVAHATRRIYAELDTRHNFLVIHNGLDPAVIAAQKALAQPAAARDHAGVAAGDVLLLLLGTVCERKGQRDAVAAMALLPADVASRVHLCIVGDRPGAYSAGLHAFARSHPGLRITFVPETAEVARWYSAADVFLCTSRLESYPRVILEAMAWGLPIITTPVFGIAEQVRNGVNALCYEPGDVTTLAGQICALANDAPRRARMASRATDVLATLNTFAEMVDDYATQFEQASRVVEVPACVALPA